MSARIAATRRTAWCAFGAVVIVCLALGCSRSAGTAVAPASPSMVAGLPVTDGPSGLREGVSLATIEVANATDSEADVLAIDAIADIEEYWRTEYPKVFNEDFVPVGRYVSYDSTKPGAEVCAENLEGVDNAAYYWPPCDTIAWDRGKLFPTLIAGISPIAPVVVMAHEYGHAVQSHSLLVNASTPTLVMEQQADCFAGAFMRHVAEGKAEHFTINTSDGLSAAMAAVMAVRDPVQIANVVHPQEHGPGFDRVSAFQMGFTGGAGACTKIDFEEIQKRRGDLPQVFAGSEDAGEVPVTEESVGVVIETLNTFFKLPQAPKVSYSGADQDCGDAKDTEPVSYCPASNSLGIDTPGLADVGRVVPRKGHDPVASGDFAAYVLVGSRYALAAQKNAGESLEGPIAARRTACYVGAWATGLATGAAGEQLSLSPGDLDEALTGLLTEGLVASDVKGETLKSGFERVEAFRLGVLDGLEQCRKQYQG